MDRQERDEMNRAKSSCKIWRLLALSQRRLIELLYESHTCEYGDCDACELYDDLEGEYS